MLGWSVGLTLLMVAGQTWSMIPKDRNADSLNPEDYIDAKYLQDCVELGDEDLWFKIQSRSIYEKTDFDKDWNAYKHGWLEYYKSNFWYGLDNINILTSAGIPRLAVGYRCNDGTIKCVVYSKFTVDDEDNQYRVHIGEEESRNGFDDPGYDLLRFNNGQPFTTRDNKTGDAVKYKGGWWYNHGFEPPYALCPNCFPFASPKIGGFEDPTKIPCPHTYMAVKYYQAPSVKN